MTSSWLRLSPIQELEEIHLKLHQQMPRLAATRQRSGYNMIQHATDLQLHRLISFSANMQLISFSASVATPQ